MHAAGLDGGSRAALALYTDKNSLLGASRPTQPDEQLRDAPARTQFGRALAELDIEWIAAPSPQAKGRVERLFGTPQDRLVKEMRRAEIATLEAANVKRWGLRRVTVHAIAQHIASGRRCRSFSSSSHAQKTSIDWMRTKAPVGGRVCF